MEGAIIVLLAAYALLMAVSISSRQPHAYVSCSNPDDFSYVPGVNNAGVYICHTGSMCNSSYEGMKAYLVSDVNQLSEGDIISFRYGKKGVTHRIIKIDYANGWVITKGDCNWAADGIIPLANITRLIR